MNSEDRIIDKNSIKKIPHSREFSHFNHIGDKSPKILTVETFITAIRLGEIYGRSYYGLIEKIRYTQEQSTRSKLKKLLPAVTISSICNNGHRKEDIVKMTGYIQIDIDNLQNVNITKDKLIKDPYIFIMFISPSGNGIKCILDIGDASISDVFEPISKYFKEKYSIGIDSQVKDETRLCFYSYDPELYLNENSKVFSEMEFISEKTVDIKTLKAEPTQDNIMNEKDKTSDVEKIISEIENEEIDITQGYGSWLKIGFALSSYFGEDGRSYFHRVSCYNLDYNKEEANKQYDECLKERKEGININTFFYYAKQHNIAIQSSEKSISQPIEIKEKKEISKYKKVETYLNNIYSFRYNVISNTIEYKNINDKEYIIANEDNIYRLLQHNNIKFSLANIKSLLRSDFVPEFNPFEEYFKNLPQWQPNDTDYINELANHINAVDQNSFNAHFKKMLVRTVVCSLDDQYFNKHVFVLVHEKQNSGKSTFCRWLCPPILKSYYTEVMNTDKDSLIALCENLIINLDELSTLNRAEINSLKSIISKQNVKVRRPFDARPCLMPRRSSFIGNTNKDEFLNDETGSVRWLCFKILGINWDYKKNIDIDLIWAQAYALYKSNFKYDLTVAEIGQNEVVNKEFNIESDENGFILKHFNKSDKENGNFYTTTDIVDFLNTRYAYLKTNTRKTGIAMKSLNFERHQEYRGTHQIKGYYLDEIFI